MKKIEIAGVKEDLYFEHLDNGLDIYMVPNKKVKNFYLTLSVKFGSINTKFNYKGKNYDLPKGVAHYLEHLNFNLPDENAFEVFSKLGANANAFTSYDITCYEVFSNSNFKENLSYLIKYVHTPYFTKEMVNNERGIITEEIKMYEDNPATELLYGIFRNVFVNDERQFLISGTAEDVKKIKLEDIETSYKAFYHPENMFLVLTGNFNPEEALAIINTSYSKLTFEKYQKPTLVLPKEPATVKKEYTKKEMNVDIPKVTIGLKIPKANFKSLKLSDLELKLYLNLFIRINFGTTSLLNEELQSNKIITDVLSMSLMETEDYFVEAIMASTSYPDYLVKKIKETFDNGDILEDDLRRKVKASISNLIMMYDDIETVNMDIQDDVITYGKFYDDIHEEYRNLNIEDAKRFVSKLNKYETSVLIINPKN